ncbi:hypothetical protein GCM10010324_10550 [Streptomyces hiroshimensis]|uniref:Integrase n=1 Tax=Streptomyces hiroshimensis TaxID=66424 RepID=A0ABQ2Y881_9ACTN|nr:hypothetical protein GCM10010324_10550 [Streptomyces hiroshimensis]
MINGVLFRQRTGVPWRDLPARFEHSDRARDSVKPFLMWCASNRLTRRFRLPGAQIRRGTQLTQQQRMKMLGQLFTNESLPLRSRVAAVIVLLYAQPVTRLVRLTIDDVTTDSDQVLLRLGEPPSPAPVPFADLLLRYIASRANMRTATNPGSRWLFPGRRAGQPMHPEALSALIKVLGIPTIAGRGAAIRQHVLEVPAPVVADALRYHQVTATRLATQAGGPWSRYAPGDHTRSPASPSEPRTRDS